MHIHSNIRLYVKSFIIFTIIFFLGSLEFFIRKSMYYSPIELSVLKANGEKANMRGKAFTMFSSVRSNTILETFLFESSREKSRYTFFCLCSDEHVVPFSDLLVRRRVPFVVVRLFNFSFFIS